MDQRTPISSRFHSSYDRAGDVLYINAVPPVAAVSDEGAPGVLWRHDLTTDIIVGVTVMEYVRRWHKQRDVLAAEIADRMHVSRDDADYLLDQAAV